MAETTLIAASRVQKWLPTYLEEYVRESGFSKYMGKSQNNIIITKSELIENGNQLNIPMVVRLTNAGVTGTNTLDGNEEELGNYNHQLTIDWLRNAVLVNKKDIHDAAFDIPMAAKSALKTWSSEKMRDGIISALGSVTNTISYAAANSTQKDAWTVANSDRVLFGAAKSNYNATHATAIGNVDNSADKLTPGIVTLAKRIAKMADPHIRPFKTADGREYYVMFAGSYPFRDLKEHATMTAANREARPRDVESNPIFQDGDLIYDGVIIREIPEILPFSNGAIDIAQNFLCGAQAAAVGWGQMPNIVVDPNKDYKFRTGIASEEYRGIEKLFFNSKQNGVVSVFTAAVADS